MPAENAVEDQERPVGVAVRESVGLAGRHQQPSAQSPQRSTSGAGQAVPGEYLRAPLSRHELGKGRLLQRQERPDFPAARADHAQRCGQQQDPERPARHEQARREYHQQRTQHQHPPAAHPVGPRGEQQRYHGVARERQRQ
jgi:hypothetical protein